MASKNGILPAGLLIFSLCVSSSDAIAANLRIGSFGIHPYVSFSAGHTDNVFLTGTNEESDTFYVISPGVKVVLPMERHTFDLDYTVDSYFYTDQDDANRTVHNATGKIDLNPSGNLNVQLKDIFIRSEDLPDFEGDRTSPFIWNRPSIDATYDFGSRLAVGLGYRHGMKTYDRSVDQIDDYDENGLSGRVYYKVLPKTSLLVTYQYQARDYEERRSEDNDSHRIEGGVTWEFGPKSLGTAQVGYMRTDYDEFNRTDDVFSYAVNLTHQIRPKTIVTLEGVREILDTSNADDNLAFSTSYVSTQIAGTLSHRYGKFTGRLKGGYIWDEYLHDDIVAGKRRKDNLVTAEFGLDYEPLRWLKVGGNYRYSRLDSNFDTEEYTENSFLVYVSLIL